MYCLCIYCFLVLMMYLMVAAFDSCKCQFKHILLYKPDTPWPVHPGDSYTLWGFQVQTSGPQRPASCHQSVHKLLGYLQTSHPPTWMWPTAGEQVVKSGGPSPWPGLARASCKPSLTPSSFHVWSSYLLRVARKVTSFQQIRSQGI